MRLPPRPPGFALVRERGLLALVEEKLAAQVRRASLLEPIALGGLLDRGGGPRGRAATTVVPLDGLPERLLLRRMRHGGALRSILGDALMGPGRPLRELVTTAALRRVGAPVPRPALAVAWRRRGPFWNAVVGTVFEEDGTDAATFLGSQPDPRRVHAAARAAGRVLRRFHDAGGCHADLHVRNLLVRETPGGFDVTVVDLDRARMLARVSPSERMRELMRLYRSLLKRGLLATMGERACVRLFHAYVDGDRTLRRALLARLPRERRRVAMHALRYGRR